MLHADSAEISSTDGLKRGVSRDFRWMGSGGSVLRQCGIFLLLSAALFRHGSVSAASGAFSPVPAEAVKELKTAKSMTVPAGLVFIDGKYVDSPYVVSRAGTAVFINGRQVTGEIVPWSDFLKAQAGYRVEMVVPPPQVVVVEEEVPVEIEEEVEIEVSEDDIDDLFGDTEEDSSDSPKVFRKIRRKVKRIEKQLRKVEKTIPSKEPPKETVVFNGPFRHNYKVKGMLSKIERERAAIEKRLRQGWVLCFGSRYRCAEGDPIAARQMLDALWGVARDNNQQEDFIREAKKNGIGFLPDVVLKDLFRNRLDYPMLQRRASKRK